MRPHNRRKLELIEIWGGCQRCGYTKSARALQFHHKDPSDKVRTGNRPLSADYRDVKAHPERYELLCANCHFELHEALDEAKRTYTPCKFCGKPVLVEPAKRADNRGAYCSRPCTEADRPNRKKPADDRFWKYVRKTETCWLWTGATHPKFGYGQINIDHRPFLARRYSWELHNGPIPPGKRLFNHCGNNSCVNPAHAAFTRPIRNL